MLILSYKNLKGNLKMCNIVRFYHISDVHLEWHDTNSPIKIIEPADSLDSVLILNGDIGMIDKQSRYNQYDTFISVCSRIFKHVILVKGNHEAYNYCFNKTVGKLRAMCSQYSNVHFLENEDVFIEDVKIFGASFFTDFGGEPTNAMAVRGAYNDFRKVRADNHTRKLHTDDYTKAYRASVRACIESEPDIVVSHYLPSLNLLERHTGALDSGMGSEPLVALDKAGVDSVRYWIYGHDHSKKVTKLGDVECRSHCRGYYGEEHYDEAIEIKSYFDFVKEW
jgi:3',5'-cyclic AMP phosphodiesterase CpdA